jgi:hypothetical protein
MHHARSHAHSSKLASAEVIDYHVSPTQLLDISTYRNKPRLQDCKRLHGLHTLP